MDRRNAYKALFASAAGLALLSKKAQAQTCTAPCFPTTAAETTAGVTPTNLSVPPYHATRYGLSTAASGTANAAALASAVAAATQAAACLRIPSGTYAYKPTAKLDFTCDVEGDGSSVLSCDSSSYTGEFFRLHGGHELRNLFIRNSTLAGQGIGLRLCDANPAAFTGHIRITRLLIHGFNRNIQVENTFMVTFDQVRSEYGNEGFYCVPDATGGNGYVTTHLHLNCYYASNTRNVYYNSSINSHNIMFTGGACELATGSNSQAVFNNIMNLHLTQWYIEGAPTTYGVAFYSVNGDASGLYLNGTGGVYLGTNAQMMFSNVLPTATSDVLVGGNGTQWVQMQQCWWPGSGNSLSFAHLNMTQVQVNGTFY